MIGAVLFDIDGTLIDSNELHVAAWRETFLAVRCRSAAGCDPRPDREGRRQPYSRLAAGPISSRRGRRRSSRPDPTCSSATICPAVVPFPGVRELFERLRSDGKRIVLASSANGDEVHYHLNLIGAGDLVESTTSADEAEHSKPDPDIFAAALAKVAPLGADEVVVVGDTPYDIEAAGKLGIKSIGFRSGGFSDDALGGAVELYDGVADLLARYERSLLSS
jgi:membrane protein